MIWPGVTYPTDTRLYEIPQDIAPLIMSSVVCSAELDGGFPTNKRRRLRRYISKKRFKLRLIRWIVSDFVTSNKD